MACIIEALNAVKMRYYGNTSFLQRLENALVCSQL